MTIEIVPIVDMENNRTGKYRIFTKDYDRKGNLVRDIIDMPDKLMTAKKVQDIVIEYLIRQGI